jgi:Protein of unknown function (DUF2721)
MDADAVTRGIQLAVAPVFMLTAVASLIAALATRLSRIIDRMRALDERLDARTIVNRSAALTEIARLKIRGRVVNVAVALLTISALLIGTTVMALFVGETSTTHTEKLVPWSFLGGVACFVLALLCFLAETLLATHALRHGEPPQ